MAIGKTLSATVDSVDLTGHFSQETNTATRAGMLVFLLSMLLPWFERTTRSRLSTTTFTFTGYEHPSAWILVFLVLFHVSLVKVDAGKAGLYTRLTWAGPGILIVLALLGGPGVGRVLLLAFAGLALLARGNRQLLTLLMGVLPLFFVLYVVFLAGFHTALRYGFALAVIGVVLVAIGSVVQYRRTHREERDGPPIDEPDDLFIKLHGDTADGNRFIELVNRSDEALDLSRATIRTGSGAEFRFPQGEAPHRPGNSKTFLLSESFTIEPGEYVRLSTMDDEYTIRWEHEHHPDER